jgi:short-subunit dehydrogenase
MKGFKEKVTYVVGGSSGIGLATAKLLAAKGAHIIIFARRKELLEQAVKGISARAISQTQRFACLPLDISDHQQVKAIMPKAISEFGLPDVLINCAGVSHPGYFDAIPYEHFDQTMKVNLYAIWNAASVLVPYMKKRGGYIVNVSSVAGFIGLFGATAYSASKFATVGFSEALRSELKPYSIQVSVLCPPDTDTPLLHEANKTKPQETKAISGKAKLMQPEEVAQALIKGMQKNQFMIIPGFDGKWIFIAKRLFPSLVESLVDSAIKRSQTRKY